MAEIFQIVLMSASLAFTVLYLILIMFGEAAKKMKITGRRKLMTVTAVLVAAVWTLHGAIEIGADNAGLAGAEKVFNSFVATIQAFGMGEEYTVFLEKIKDMIFCLPEYEWVKIVFSGAFRSFIFGFYCVYSSFLYIAAPVTGGAIIFEIIASIFPRIKLFFASFTFWREILYFSELNEESLALAKNIKKQAKSDCAMFCRPIIVFTDVYTKDDEEQSVERLLNAKGMGAVCIRDDILHIGLRKWHKIFRPRKSIDEKEAKKAAVSALKALEAAKTEAEKDAINRKLKKVKNKIDAEEIKRNRKFFKKKIFLIDTNDMVNLQALTGLTSKECYKGLLCSEVYLFSKSDVSNVVEHKIRKDLSESIGDSTLDASVYIINGKRNIMRNLFADVPLYDPLVGKIDLKDEVLRKKGYDLNVTIMGIGEIGTEAFLSAYWYGQMLGCRLHLNVISKESEEEFKSRINNINPDIFKSAEPGSSVLKIYDDLSEYSEPYFKFRYFQTDIFNDNLETELTARKYENDSFRYVDSDYFVISLGSDSVNLDVAERLNRLVSVNHMKEKGIIKNTVIAYAIYNSDLCKALNEKQYEHNYGVYMHAFASMEEVYDVKNVYMTANRDAVSRISNSYEQAEQSLIMKSCDDNYYEFWANIARAFHIRYKVFSAGYINSSVFSCADKSEREALLNEALERYKNDIVPYAPENIGDSEKDCIKLRSQIEENNEKKRESSIFKELTWLEHRRWCAFMRISGFTLAEDIELYAPIIKSHKNLELKLHPCLVECDKFGAGEYIGERELGARKPDRLDTTKTHVNSVLLKYDIIKKDALKKFKLYDCPGFEFKCNDKGEVIEDV